MVRLFHKCNHLECVREHYVHSIQSLQISISSTAGGVELDRRCGAARQEVWSCSTGGVELL
jgi:hypothetical protein